MLPFKGSTYAVPLAELHALCFNKPWSADEFGKILSLPTTFGFGNEQGFILCADLQDDVEILTLAVHPSYRRQGIASSLLKEVQNFLITEGKHRIFLEVNVKNTSAQKLYSKSGFQQIGVRKNYYHDGQKRLDALCLMWQNPKRKSK